MHFSKFEFFLPTLHRICQGRFSFPNIASHSPISSLIPQFTSHWPICLSFSNFTSFANLPLIPQFASHSPICLSFPNLPLSLPKDPIYQLYLTHFPNHLPHLPKGAEKISLTPPNTYPEGEKASVGLYTALIQSLVFFFFFFFLSRAHTLSKIGHRFALGKGVLTFQQKISFCQISSLWENENIFKVKFWVPLTSQLSKYAQKSNKRIFLK